MPASALARFLPAWQQVAGVETGGSPATVVRAAGRGLRGVDGLARVIEQLAGYPVPASALETLVLPARVVDYSPAMLDELTAAGEVTWAGHAPLAARDGLVSLHPTATADLTLAPTGTTVDTPLHRAVRAALAGGGGWFLDPLVARVQALAEDDAPDLADGRLSTAEVVDGLWDLVWSGEVTNDGVGPLRSRLGARAAGTTHRVRASVPRGRALRAGLELRPSGRTHRHARTPRDAGRCCRPVRRTRPSRRGRSPPSSWTGTGWSPGRWPPRRAWRAGSPRCTGCWPLSRSPDGSAVGTSSSTSAARSSRCPEPSTSCGPPLRDTTRWCSRPPTRPTRTGPRWAGRPAAAGHRPGRTPGAIVVIVDGDLVFYLERGGRTVLSFGAGREEAERAEHLGAGALALADLVRTGRLGRVTLRRLDGAEVLDRDVLAGPAARALSAAGFTPTPSGLRLG